MPCNSDYLEQTGKEAGLQKAAQLLRFVVDKFDEMGLEANVTPDEVSQANVYYAQDTGQVEKLCMILTLMTPEQLEAVVYDAHNPKSRDLAIWWEAHQAADAARIASERAAANTAALINSAVSKLTPEEFKAVRSA